MTTISPVITSTDRLSFTVFLALVMHAIIISVGFTFFDKQPSNSTHTMEITLAQHRSKNQPDKADFLAQFDQAGSGTLTEKALTTSPNQSEFHDTVIRETAPIAQVSAAAAIQQQLPVITTTQKNNVDAPFNPEPERPNPAARPSEGNKSIRQRSLEIASLEARLDRQRQLYAKRPRIKRLTSLSTASSKDAYYLNSWRRKIEKIGNLNYPAKARKEKLFGSLRLLVAILPDGSLREVTLLESSGHQVLDNAALNIVRLAAPFAPFPDNLRQSTDVLEIIRTWQFRKNSSLRSY